MTLDLSLSFLGHGPFDFDLHLIGEEPAAIVPIQFHFDLCSFGKGALRTVRTIVDVNGLRRRPR